MEKFTSIESFKHAIAKVRRYYNNLGQPYPTIEYRGTVKIHGTNASVHRTNTGELIVQSRERILNITSDNAGFCMFIEQNKDAVTNLFARFNPSDDVVLYGEWCGGNIQKGVAVTQLEKHWVLFSVKVNGEYKDLNPTVHDNEHKIFNIGQIPDYHVTVDFMNPEPASNILSDLTLAVEKECPWGKFRGVEGIGEGLVWTPMNDIGISDIWFKTKGLLHKGNDKTKVPKIKISDEKLASIRELADEILPEWRLEQGISYLRENNLDIIPQNTSHYLKWIMQDIHKECMETIVASGFEWKQIQGQLTTMARQFYLTECNKV